MLGDMAALRICPDRYNATQRHINPTTKSILSLIIFTQQHHEHSGRAEVIRNAGPAASRVRQTV